MTSTETGPAAAGFAERDVTVHETRVRVLTAGSGEPLLYLHDPGDLGPWSPLLASLAGHFGLAAGPPRLQRQRGRRRDRQRARVRDARPAPGRERPDVRLALFDDFRLGVVTGDQIVDVTGALPAYDADPVTAGWWRALCRDFPALRAGLQAAADAGPARPLAAVRLRAPALGPSKVIACASNFTGAPPGVGPIYPGDVLTARISRIGSITIGVR
jgi:hypothetical protein